MINTEITGEKDLFLGVMKFSLLEKIGIMKYEI